MDVRVDKLRKSYPTPTAPLVVLDGVDLALDSGEAVAITGPSGSGKSTLLHILGTIDTPTEGDITLDGDDPFSLAEAELARFRNLRVGFVFQDHYLLPQCTVLENVLVPTFASRSRDGDGAGVGDGQAEARAAELLARVGLTERVDHRPSELSGGERQRAAIARALIQRPGLLLCDEPTGNLDLRNARTMGDLLLELQENLGCTLVAVTHSVELAERFQRRFTLSGGQLAEER